MSKHWWYAARKKIWHEGVILGLADGESLPSGWSVYSDADDKFLVGTSSSDDVKDTAARSAISYYTEYDGGHGEHGYNAAVTLIKDWGHWNGPYGGPYPNRNDPSENTFRHRHALSVDYKPAANSLKLIRAGGSAAEPVGAVMFGTAAHEVQSGYDLFNVATDGYLYADDTTQTVGSARSATIGSGGASHTHWQPSSYDGALYQNYVGAKTSMGAAGAAHTHGGSMTPTITPALQQAVVRAFKIVDGFDVNGLIGMWDQVGCPLNWEVVADFNGRFLRFASDGDGSLSGDNTIAISGSMALYSHSHTPSGSSAGPDNVSAIYHTKVHSHRHSIDNTVGYTPELFKIKFIRYVG